MAGANLQVDLVGPAALLAAKPDLCHRSEHSRLAANLIDPSLPTATSPYTYSIADASDSWFTATATRSGSSSWSGSFTIAADGTFSGCGAAIRPRRFAGAGIPVRTTRRLTTPVPSRTRGRAARGYTLLEVQVAFAILGIGLAGFARSW